MKIILASQSPRRKELLQSLGLAFETIKIKVDEIYPENLPIREIPAHLAALKAEAHRPFLQSDDLLITADTLVTIEGKVLGKPKDYGQAVEMLELLSGKTHEVITGVRITSREKYFEKTNVAKVSFETISKEEIDYYITHYQPFDKAGSYGIQEWLGMAKCSKIEGSYYTIMGLPTHVIYEGLKTFGFE